MRQPFHVSSKKLLPIKVVEILIIIISIII